MINNKNNSSCLYVIGTRIDLVQIPYVVERISGWIENKELGNYIVVSNAHDVVTGKKDDKVKKAANASSLTVPDGISLVLLARLMGCHIKKRVYGPALMLEFLKLSELRGYSNFFYGTTQETLSLLVNNLRFKFPNIKIVGMHSPPFRPLNEAEDKEIIDIINRVSPDILWVGLGTPKQQLWMYGHKDKLRVPVMVGVGAAFDFLAGIKPQAPRWIGDNGFEWLFRLATEPKRLWRRYLLDYPLFFYYVLRDFITKVLSF
jgi:N-acetylglucosaminyldiphosphoundecaprenol N-acetyl-beta-D-mannosaminyltransferase